MELELGLGLGPVLLRVRVPVLLGRLLRRRIVPYGHERLVRVRVRVRDRVRVGLGLGLGLVPYGHKRLGEAGRK